MDQVAEQGSMQRAPAWDAGPVVANDQCALPAVYRTVRSVTVEHALGQRMLRSTRVKILPGTAFACPEPGWFRLCHATDASTVATGVNRLIRALKTS
jgi:aspartate/methionine/tyrosine aminotransferase